MDGLSTKGVNTNDPGIRVNYDAWDEVQVVSDGFAAELGQALGGFVNVVTKSGGNAFHGEAGALVRDRACGRRGRSSSRPRACPRPRSRTTSATSGGRSSRTGSGSSSPTTSSPPRTGPPSSRSAGSPSRRESVGRTTNNVFGKLTWTPRQNHTVSASGTLDKSLHQTGGIGVPETYAKTEYDNSSYRLNYQGILSSSFFVTAAAGHNRRSSSTEPLSGDYGPPSYFWQDIAQRTNNIGLATSLSIRGPTSRSARAGC